MCSRYSITASPDALAARFEVDIPPAFYKPRFNAAPSQLLPVITADSPQGLSLFYWGLPPERSHNRSITERIINLRLEAIAERPVHQKALASRRCLVPADGYYEWKRIGKKQNIPYRVVRQDKSIFSFPGIWEEYEDEAGDPCHTFTIITTGASSATQSIHDRMPIMLTKPQEALWLDKKISQTELLELLKTTPTDPLEVYSVSPRINNLTVDDVVLTLPAPAADQHGNLSLFD